MYVRLLRTTTEEITTTWLLPEMVERVASMLDYFMAHLAGALSIVSKHGEALAAFQSAMPRKLAADS